MYSSHDICVAQIFGPGIPAPVRTYTRPGRPISAGLQHVVSFIGHPNNLHRLPSSASKDYQGGCIVLKRKEKRAAMYRSYVTYCEADEKVSVCSEKFFYSVFDRMEGIVFSDRVAMECGCVMCISMIVNGWRELLTIIRDLCRLLRNQYNVDEGTLEKLENVLSEQVEDARRFWHAEYKHHWDDGKAHPTHCPQFALCKLQDIMTCAAAQVPAAAANVQRDPDSMCEQVTPYPRAIVMMCLPVIFFKSLTDSTSKTPKR